VLTVAGRAGRWTGGRYGVGNRIKLRYTRAIIDAIHSGELKTAQTSATPMFGLAVRSPRACWCSKRCAWALRRLTASGVGRSMLPRRHMLY
jgi:hypothetical protein